jgi:hypothetical protein
MGWGHEFPSFHTIKQAWSHEICSYGLGEICSRKTFMTSHTPLSAEELRIVAQEALLPLLIRNWQAFFMCRVVFRV